jgi:hypothetical protein
VLWLKRYAAPALVGFAYAIVLWASVQFAVLDPVAVLAARRRLGLEG